MGALNLDYQRDHRPAPWLGWAILLLAVAMLASLAWHYRALDRRTHAWEAKAAHLERLGSVRASLAKVRARPAARVHLREVQQANGVVRQLTLPWNDLFGAVEDAGDEHVALLSLAPDVRTGTVKISGEARDLGALLDYVERLAGQPAFDNVFLESHRVQQDEAEKPLRFSVRARWRGVAP